MVLEVTARDVADVANVQAFIGGELAARAAENITDEQLSALRAIQDELEEAYGSGDLDRMVRLNHEFHRLVNVAADSPKLTQFMSGITRYAPESVFPTLSRLARRSRPGTTAASSRRSSGAMPPGRGWRWPNTSPSASPRSPSTSSSAGSSRERTRRRRMRSDGRNARTRSATLPTAIHYLLVL